jgi:hypothetical protein
MLHIVVFYYIEVRKISRKVLDLVMEARELRIGNCIIWRGANHIIESISKNEIRIDWYYPDNITTVEELEPTPLTNEILKKCGFNDDDNLGTRYSFQVLRSHEQLISTHEYVLGKFEHESTDEFRLACDDYTFDIQLPHIKYLHQLQNLHFALTGEELKITL